MQTITKLLYLPRNVSPISRMSDSIDVIPRSVRVSLKRISKEFEKHGIPAMAVGGIAVVFHGRARLSRDLDVAVALNLDKAREILSIIRNSATYGIIYPNNSILTNETKLDSSEDLGKLNLVKIRDKETNVVIDILLVWNGRQSFYGLDGRSFERAKKVDTDDEESFWIPSVEDFILMKLVARRPATSDFEDLFSAMVKYLSSLDWNYLESKAEELNVKSLLQSYRKIAEDRVRKNNDSERRK
ncbi:MAG: nucleotidyltransferase family protein [Nitrososphaerales archaeon]